MSYCSYFRLKFHPISKIISWGSRTLKKPKTIINFEIKRRTMEKVLIFIICTWNCHLLFLRSTERHRRAAKFVHFEKIWSIFWERYKSCTQHPEIIYFIENAVVGPPVKGYNVCDSVNVKYDLWISPKPIPHSQLAYFHIVCAPFSHWVDLLSHQRSSSIRQRQLIQDPWKALKIKQN